jgi:aspartate aminotransferase-like enzyme
VITIPVPSSLDATTVGDALKGEGLVVAYQSEYLVRRNWLQVSLMGQCSERELDRLLVALGRRMGTEALAAGAS